ncbi:MULTISPECIES: hypothetical protein [Microbacterium]|uniref:hypothetical protein n=1 Tax=Microbacterium TaxID=33882 RepID=UPI00168AF27D|nr:MULTISPECIES: hypothetical protein [Microbacterium]QOC24657.1 hypothetical protein IC745_09655 [Microbacterium hominis]QYF99043.1 hypothetical protein KY498_07490 [Microbacterium sp. PAMC21962]
MQLSYATPRLRQQFLDPSDGDWPSPEHLRDMRQQVADMTAAESLLEVPLGVPPLASVNAAGFKIVAGTSVVLRCRVDHHSFRVTAGGKPAWSQINRLMINGWEEA